MDKIISEKLKQFLEDNRHVLPVLDNIDLNQLKELELSELLWNNGLKKNYVFMFEKYLDGYQALYGFERDHYYSEPKSTLTEGLETAVMEFVNSFNYIDETGDYLYKI